MLQICSPHSHGLAELPVCLHLYLHQQGVLGELDNSLFTTDVCGSMAMGSPWSRFLLQVTNHSILHPFAPEELAAPFHLRWVARVERSS